MSLVSWASWWHKIPYKPHVASQDIQPWWDFGIDLGGLRHKPYAASLCIQHGWDLGETDLGLSIDTDQG